MVGIIDYGVGNLFSLQSPFSIAGLFVGVFALSFLKSVKQIF